MNVYEMLHKDHEKVMSLFDQLESSGEDEERRRERIFSSLYMELSIHSDAEERFFYSRLKRLDSTRDVTLESLDDHKSIKQALDELDIMDKGTPEWSAKCLDLRESVERHVDMEEQELFPLARKIIGYEEAAGIAEDIESFKEEMTELEAY